jgi:hypothetical protein
MFTPRPPPPATRPSSLRAVNGTSGAVVWAYGALGPVFTSAAGDAAGRLYLTNQAGPVGAANGRLEPVLGTLFLVAVGGGAPGCCPYAPVSGCDLTAVLGSPLCSTVLLAINGADGTLAWSSVLATNVTGTYSRCVRVYSLAEQKVPCCRVL